MQCTLLESFSALFRFLLVLIEDRLWLLLAWLDRFAAEIATGKWQKKWQALVVQYHFDEDPTLLLLLDCCSIQVYKFRNWDCFIQSWNCRQRNMLFDWSGKCQQFFRGMHAWLKFENFCFSFKNELGKVTETWSWNPVWIRFDSNRALRFGEWR